MLTVRVMLNKEEMRSSIDFLRKCVCVGGGVEFKRMLRKALL